MLYSVWMIEKFIIGEAFYAQSASVLRVIRIPNDLGYSPVFPMNHYATTGHAPFANRPDDLSSHLSPPAILVFQ
jgi:hypothetical protein